MTEATAEIIARIGSEQAAHGINLPLAAIAPAPAWLKQSWTTAKRSGVAKMSTRDIDREICRNRREKEKKGRREPRP